MLNLKNQRILILAPHTDDAEFGCGATMAKLIEQNNEVFSVSFSACQQSVLKQFPPDILITEVKEASIEIGIKKENLILMDYAVRTFNFKRQEILDDMLKLRKDIEPTVVFMPTMDDLHQDHLTIAHEGLRAFKFSTIFSYELPWNNLAFATTAFSIISEENLQKKINAVSRYKSQAHRNYANEEFIRSLARVRGTQINERYAECFELIRIKF
jgi:LmbE family N-acetylglucosaminyl deacetylase